MSIKNTIFLFIIIVLSIIFIVSESQIVMTISFLGAVLLMLSMKLSDYLLRRKFIKKIERENIEYIKVKENNKLVIILMLISIFNIYRPIKSRYDVFKGQYNHSFANILTYINSFKSYEKLVILMAIAVIVFAIITILQALLNPSIVSKDKVIFYDGLVFDIDKIESIEYENSLIRKNKKIIKLSKGFVDRKIITDIENFDKVKILLKCKN